MLGAIINMHVCFQTAFELLNKLISKVPASTNKLNEYLSARSVKISFDH